MKLNIEINTEQEEELQKLLKTGFWGKTLPDVILEIINEKFRELRLRKLRLAKMELEREERRSRAKI